MQYAINMPKARRLIALNDPKWITFCKVQNIHDSKARQQHGVVLAFAIYLNEDSNGKK